MKIIVVAVGGVKGPLAGAVAEYEARAGRYWKLEVAEVDAGARGRDPDPERVMAAEAERILSRIPEGLEVVALTREAKQMRSRMLARYLQQLMVGSAPGVAFVLGGAYGLDGTVLSRARRKISLSAMTLPHEMARLVLVEQLYRAGTILRNEPYHKGD